MYKNILQTTKYIVACTLLSVTLCGCDIVPSLSLTEEQSALVAEFAAGKLLEYVKGHPGGLMILEDVDRTEVNPGLKKPEEEPAPLPGTLPGQPVEDQVPPDMPQAPAQEDGNNDKPNDTSDGDALVETPVVDELPTMTLAEALGINGADIKYDHNEITSTYPENATELAFSMKAAPGKELLVVHFALSNPGSGDVEAYTDSSNFKVRLLVNGSEKIRGDVTFLDNDLMNYRGTITAGASVDSVLVFEVPEGTKIDSMDLLIVVDGKEQKYKLV